TAGTSESSPATRPALRKRAIADMRCSPPGVVEAGAKLPRPRQGCKKRGTWCTGRTLACGRWLGVRVGVRVCGRLPAPESEQDCSDQDDDGRVDENIPAPDHTGEGEDRTDRKQGHAMRERRVRPAAVAVG